MASFDLNDEGWAAIRPYLPKQGRDPQRKDDRTVLNGIFYILRTGAPWRDLPARYGPPTTVYNCYIRSGECGVWRTIFYALATECEVALIFVHKRWQI
jgi:transposase